MDKTTALIYLLGILVGAVLFSYLLVKSAESVITSRITSSIATFITNITNYCHKYRQYPQWCKYIINYSVSIYTHLKDRFKCWIRITELVYSRNKQNDTRSPESTIDVIPKEKLDKFPHSPNISIEETSNQPKENLTKLSSILADTFSKYARYSARQ
jgi:hypothetical protein